MMHIAIVLPKHFQWWSVSTALEVFETTLAIRARLKQGPHFQLHLVQAFQKGLRDTTFMGQAIKTTRSRLKTQLLIVPAIQHSHIDDSIHESKELITWINQQYKDGAEIASLSSGAFLLAESGLLHAKLATTHAELCAHFILRYPHIFVKPGRSYTVDWNCYTSGGGISSIHLLVFLIQKFFGKETAVHLSKHLALEPAAARQSYFSTFRPVYSHNDDLIIQLQKQLETHYTKIKNIDELTRHYPTSRRNLLRRFIKATGLPPSEYLQNIRIEKAKQLLENSDQRVSEIISQTGYTDPKSFRKIFLKLVGIPPLAYRKKFNLP